jgi:hypothetical protein
MYNISKSYLGREGREGRDRPVVSIYKGSVLLGPPGFPSLPSLPSLSRIYIEYVYKRSIIYSS